LTRAPARAAQAVRRRPAQGPGRDPARAAVPVQHPRAASVLDGGPDLRAPAAAAGRAGLRAGRGDPRPAGQRAVAPADPGGTGPAPRARPVFPAVPAAAVAAGRRLLPAVVAAVYLLAGRELPAQ